MDETLRKKILYAVCIGIVVLFAVIALLFLLRKPQKQTVVTRTEYLNDEKTPQVQQGQPLTDVTALLPKLSEGSNSAIPLSQTNTTTSKEESEPTLPTTTTTTTADASKAWSFFKQAMSLPWVMLSSTFPTVSGCGNANQQVCPSSPNSVTVVTEETHITNITFIQQVVELPFALQDNLQDIIFYKFITLLQQSAIVTETYPEQSTPESTSWLTELIRRGEMSQFYYDVFIKGSSGQAKGCKTSQQTGFCYESNGKSANLYVRLKAGTAECPHGAIKSWNSDKNALQVTCF